MSVIGWMDADALRIPGLHSWCHHMHRKTVIDPDVACLASVLEGGNLP